MAELRRLAQPSLVCDASVMERVSYLGFVAREFLHSKAKALLEGSCGTACLIWHGNDTTPTTTKERWQLDFGSSRVVRRARRLSEFVVQRVFIEGSFGATAMLLEEPKRVVDKTALSHFELQRCLFPTPRDLMPTGILVEAHCWGGALFSACDRLSRQLFAAYHFRMSSTQPEGMH